MKIFRGPAYDAPLRQSFINGIMDAAVAVGLIVIAAVGLIGIIAIFLGYR